MGPRLKVMFKQTSCQPLLGTAVAPLGKSVLLWMLSVSMERVMQVKEIMTRSPVCCTKHSSLTDVARLMREHDCGAVPVVDDDATGNHLVGIVSDRDIVVRSVADGADPSGLTAGDCMTMVVATVTTENTVEECAKLMEEHRVRRVPVVDGHGNCCGILTLADLACQGPLKQIVEVVREVSHPPVP